MLSPTRVWAKDYSELVGAAVAMAMLLTSAGER